MGRIGWAATAAMVLLAIAVGATSVQAETADERRERLQRQMDEIDAKVRARGGILPGDNIDRSDDAGGSKTGANHNEQCGDIARSIKVAMTNGDTARTLVGIYAHQLFGCGPRGMDGVLGLPSLAIE